MNSEITVVELKDRIDKGEKLIIIDVREPYEYAEFNIGGILLPLGELQARLIELEDYLDNEIIVHCRSGARSIAAQNYMKKMGYDHVRNLTGGILAWQSEFSE